MKTAGTVFKANTSVQRMDILTNEYFVPVSPNRVSFSVIHNLNECVQQKSLIRQCPYKALHTKEILLNLIASVSAECFIKQPLVRSYCSMDLDGLSCGIHF